MKNLLINIGYYQKELNTIDANLHPDEQYVQLVSFLEDRIENGEDIVIYTNSPYIFDKLTILQGYNTHNVPCTYFKYVLDHNFMCLEFLIDGTTKIINKYKEMISDENLLNDRLGESNEEFSTILDAVQTREFENKQLNK